MSEVSGVSEAREALQELLGPAPAPPLAALSEEQVRELTATVAAARARQGAALRQAMEAGLDFVPKVLRAPVRKVLFR